MTVKNLIKALQAFPENMEVFLDERKTEFTYGLLNSVRAQEIDFKEDPDGETLAVAMVVILDEE